MKHRQKMQRLLLEGYGAGCTKKNKQIIIFHYRDFPSFQRKGKENCFHLISILILCQFQCSYIKNA